jgi:hypothetical protein
MNGKMPFINAKLSAKQPTEYQLQVSHNLKQNNQKSLPLSKAKLRQAKYKKLRKNIKI